MDVEHVWQPSASAALYGEHAQQRLGTGAQRAKVRQAGKTSSSGAQCHN